jgi:hypothetical protein
MGIYIFNMMNKLIFIPFKKLIFIIVLIFIVGSCNNVIADVETYASLQQENSNYLLNITIKNESDKKIRIPRGLLPWSETPWNNLIILAINIDQNNKIIQKANLIRNPVGYIDIEPSQEATGTISLNKFFPSLEKVVQESDVVLFWSYQVPKQNKIEYRRSGGWVLIKRNFCGEDGAKHPR